MGLTQSITNTNPPRPSTSTPSTGVPNITPLPSLLSYFMPSSTPKFTHSHLPPNPNDIKQISSLLIQKGLPAELIPKILDYASYWPACRCMSTRSLTLTANRRSPRLHYDNPWTGGQEEELEREMCAMGSGLRDRNGEVWYLVTRPLGCGYGDDEGEEEKGKEKGKGKGNEVETDDEERVKEVDANAALEGSVEDGRIVGGWLRKVVVETLSQDQGWSTGSPAEAYGTYEHSYSWFEISLLRNGIEVPDSRIRIQNNVHAGQYAKAHINTLEADHPFVQAAKPGDRIVLWVRAQYQGWQNKVQEAAITTWTAAYPLD